MILLHTLQASHHRQNPASPRASTHWLQCTCSVKGCFLLAQGLLTSSGWGNPADLSTVLWAVVTPSPVRSDPQPAGRSQSVQSLKSCPTLCNPMDCSMLGFPVHHQLPELAQTHVHQVGDAIQPFHPLSSPSPPVLNLSQHQGLFQLVSSSYQVAKVLEFQLQHQSFQ